MKVSKDTIARTIVLAVALINQVLAILGKGTFDFAEEEIYQLVTLLFTIVASARAWWKNNSFTHEAKLSDEYLQKLKSEKYMVGSENDEVNSEEEHVIAEGGAE